MQRDAAACARGSCLRPAARTRYTSSLPFTSAGTSDVGAVEEQPAAVGEVARLIERTLKSRRRSSPEGSRTASVNPALFGFSHVCGRSTSSPRPSPDSETSWSAGRARAGRIARRADERSGARVVEVDLLIRFAGHAVEVVVMRQAAARHEGVEATVGRDAGCVFDEVAAGRQPVRFIGVRERRDERRRFPAVRFGVEVLHVQVARRARSAFPQTRSHRGWLFRPARWRRR